MRIISGSLKGRTLQAPEGMHTRPTTDALREAIFDAIVHHIDIRDRRILDLCCGSGALAFEAISRGAAAATLVDVDADVCRLVRSNAITLGISDRVTIAKADAVDFATTLRPESFDVILADPPYPARICNKLLHAITMANAVPLDGLVIMEHDDVETLLPMSQWRRCTTLHRGPAVVDILRRVEPSS